MRIRMRLRQYGVFSILFKRIKKPQQHMGRLMASRSPKILIITANLPRAISALFDHAGLPQIHGNNAASPNIHVANF